MVLALNKLQNLLMEISLFFMLFSLILIIMQRNPVYAVFSFILTAMATFSFLLLIGAEFFALLILIIYTGVITVLFLFIVSMYNLREINASPTIQLRFWGWLLLLIGSVLWPVITVDAWLVVVSIVSLMFSIFKAFSMWKRREAGWQKWLLTLSAGLRVNSFWGGAVYSLLPICTALNDVTKWWESLFHREFLNSDSEQFFNKVARHEHFRRAVLILELMQFCPQFEQRRLDLFKAGAVVWDESVNDLMLEFREYLKNNPTRVTRGQKAWVHTSVEQYFQLLQKRCEAERLLSVIDKTGPGVSTNKGGLERLRLACASDISNFNALLKQLEVRTKIITHAMATKLGNAHVLSMLKLTKFEVQTFHIDVSTAKEDLKLKQLLLAEVTAPKIVEQAVISRDTISASFCSAEAGLASAAVAAGVGAVLTPIVVLETPSQQVLVSNKHVIGLSEESLSKGQQPLACAQSNAQAATNSVTGGQPPRDPAKIDTSSYDNSSAISLWWLSAIMLGVTVGYIVYNNRDVIGVWWAQLMLSRTLTEAGVHLVDLKNLKYPALIDVLYVLGATNQHLDIYRMLHAAGLITKEVTFEQFDTSLHGALNSLSEEKRKEILEQGLSNCSSGKSLVTK